VGGHCPFRGLVAPRALIAIVHSRARRGKVARRTRAIVHGYEVDCYWKHARSLSKWTDTRGMARRGHSCATANATPALTAAGIHVLRLSWEQLADEREKTLVQLTQGDR
jgi:hypothetical protein